ncbi:flagellar basal-body MS-ring/collar protein FliF [Buchnera aphidicola (Chaitoregma tattakana)]|uniref:flagellar basal-body MS-ring/collar protein FliF n=1 Tax=Buchnera aphidicola TaxID=9 RepID=UPI0031B86B50
MNRKLSFEKNVNENKIFNNIFNIVKKNIILCLILLSASITLIFSILFLYKSTNYCTLYNNLSNEDKSLVIFELSSMNIPYKINDSKNKIKIPKKLVYQVRMHLSEKGIPKDNIDGFEILDKEKFGESQFREKINYQRALEGELSKTIMKIDSIKNATVHLVMHSKSVFFNDDIESTASVLLTLKFGKKLDINKINAILNLVSKSVSGLKYNNITIVDQYGNFLNQSMDMDTYNDSKLVYINNIEKKYKRKIEEILVPLFGIDNVYAQVTAQIDFDKKEKVEEKYKPNSNKLDQAIRSKQSSYSKDLNNSNDNYVHNKNSIKEDVNIQDGVKNLSKNDKKQHNIFNNNKSIIDPSNTNSINTHNYNPNIIGNKSYNFDNTTNYEVDHDVINTKVNIGNLKKISAGIVINYVKDSKGNFVPLSSANIEKIKDLIKNSIGFSENRGDTVNLVNSMFYRSPEIKKHNVILTDTDRNLVFQKRYYLIPIIVVMFIILYELLFKKIFFFIFFKNKVINKNDKIYIRKNKLKVKKDEKKVKKESSLLPIIKPKKTHKNIFEKKSSFIAKIIRNWINKK